jgi:hypothetical protein
VHARDQSCRFPTCSGPARLCQDDPTIPAGAPGWTPSDGNLGPLSSGCHNAKTHAGSRLDQPEPGRFVWTAPTGHVYEVDPEIVGPITTPPTPTHPSTTSNPNGRPTSAPTHHHSDWAPDATLSE